MKRHLLLAIGLLVPAEGVAAAGVPALSDGVETEARRLTVGDARKRLNLIAAWTGTTDAAPDKSIGQHAVASAIVDLRANPDASIPVLIEGFIEKHNDRNFRALCAHTLREMGAPIPSDSFQKLEGLFRDLREDPLLRVDAAHFLIRDHRNTPRSLKDGVLALASELLRSNKESAHVRLLLIRPLMNESRAHTIMLDELDRKSDLDQTLLLVGKMRILQAVPTITNLLANHSQGNRFSRTRAYLALGEIGGAQAANALIVAYRNHPKRMDRRILLLALGLSKDSRAKRILLDNLKQRGDTYGAAIQGLGYLGDKSTVAALQQELEETAAPDKKSALRRAVVAIDSGGATPDW